MTTGNQDRARITVPPLLWFLLSLGAGWLLGHLTPWPLPGPDGVVRRTVETGTIPGSWQ